MTKEIEFNEVPAFAHVKERIYTINPNVELVKAGQDKDSDTYILRLQLTSRRHTDLTLSLELLDDLNGKRPSLRNLTLDRDIHLAIGRIK